MKQSGTARYASLRNVLAFRRGAFLCALNDCVNICNIVDFACEIRLLKGYILRMGEWHQFTMPAEKWRWRFLK